MSDLAKRKKKNIPSKVSRLLEIPQEVSTSLPKVTVVGFEKILIENYKSILEYQEFYIRISTFIGILNINGYELNLKEMTTDDLLVTGKIESIDFEAITDEEQGDETLYFQILLGHLLGYVTIDIEGYFMERFINLCNSQKIFLWNLQRTNSTSMKVNMNIRDFKKIKEIAKKTKCRDENKNEKGNSISFTSAIKRGKFCHFLFIGFNNYSCFVKFYLEY